MRVVLFAPSILQDLTEPFFKKIGPLPLGIGLHSKVNLLLYPYLPVYRGFPPWSERFVEPVVRAQEEYSHPYDIRWGDYRSPKLFRSRIVAALEETPCYSQAARDGDPDPIRIGTRMSWSSLLLLLLQRSSWLTTAAGISNKGGTGSWVAGGDK